jgi:hypothetical protein
MVAVPVLLILLLSLLIAVRRVSGWPADAYQGWALLATALLALVPLMLLVVETAVRNRGKISAFGVSLSFSGASNEASAALRTTRLEENLDIQGEEEALQTSGLPSLIAALRRAHDSDVTVVDLQVGRTWWETRLFILVAGAARRGRPRALAFVGERNGQRGVFLGWSSPSRLLDQHLAADDRLRRAYRAAVSLTAQFEMSTPATQSSSCRLTPWGTPTQQICLPPMARGVPDPDFALELFLQQELEHANDQQRRYVSITRLLELYEPVLVTDHVGKGSSEGVWLDLLRKPRAFFAVTENGVLLSLVARDALMTALVLRLAQAEDRE